MKLEDLLIRLKKKSFLPRKRSITPRVAEGLEERLEPLYQEALKDYRENWDQVQSLVREHAGITLEGEPFPEGEPELRVTDRVMGSEALQGMSMVEELDGLHSVVNIADAVAGDSKMVMLHELLHTSFSQRGLEGDFEEELGDAVAEKVG